MDEAKHRRPSPPSKVLREPKPPPSGPVTGFEIGQGLHQPRVVGLGAGDGLLADVGRDPVQSVGDRSSDGGEGVGQARTALFLLP